jgi:hypothetical protein
VRIRSWVPIGPPGGSIRTEDPIGTEYQGMDEAV